MFNDKMTVDWKTVMKIALRFMKGLEHVTYDENVGKLELLSLGKRKLKGDLITVYRKKEGRKDEDKRRSSS